VATTRTTFARIPRLNQLSIVLVVRLDHQPDGVAVFIPAIFFDANAGGEFSTVKLPKAADLAGTLRLG
jgi:hypothetical protein